ncbi:hypothetical protein [Nostoc sp. FACHB-110]|uniref:hypothetical protein n=1 Tax=Nostoc sp. FACHB-110 TaxID=2692834 RepID=UPI00168731D9|nr:hypothetical protein [Nostoc sp. FACHB-110]MBD2438846.1 hypothetical protein [Nostoc sp. FACHB-110]
MKKLEIATKFAYYKVFLAILGVVALSLYLGLWKWNKEQNEKYVAEREEACQQSIKDASNNVLSNRFLKSNYYANLMQKKPKFKLKQPGINTDFQANKDYILMYSQPASLIPKKPRYEGRLFEKLSRETDKKPPAPLMVTGKKLLANRVEVISACSPQPFTVSLENLYEVTQAIDVSPFLPPFSSF